MTSTFCVHTVYGVHLHNSLHISLFIYFTDADQNPAFDMPLTISQK